jgi:hypothetical protein
VKKYLTINISYLPKVQQRKTTFAGTKKEVNHMPVKKKKTVKKKTASRKTKTKSKTKKRK